MSLCRRTVEDRLPLERMPLAFTLGSPLNLHVRQSLGLQGVSLSGGIICGKGTLAPIPPLADQKWTRWPKVLA